MSTVTAELQRKWQTIRAVVTCADGTVEDRGIVAFSHTNPVIHFIGNLYVKAHHRVGEWRAYLKGRRP
jgi:hypothetical protein